VPMQTEEPSGTKRATASRMDMSLGRGTRVSYPRRLRWPGLAPCGFVWLRHNLQLRGVSSVWLGSRLLGCGTVARVVTAGGEQLRHQAGRAAGPPSSMQSSAANTWADPRLKAADFARPHPGAHHHHAGGLQRAAQLAPPAMTAYPRPRVRPLGP